MNPRKRWRLAAFVFAAASFASAGFGIGSLGSRRVKSRVILLDVSASVTRAPGNTLEGMLGAGSAGLTASDRVAVVEFAGRARVAVPWGPLGQGIDARRERYTRGEGLDPMHSDLRTAMDLANSLLAGEGGGQVVAVSDGLATSSPVDATPRGGTDVALVPPGGSAAVNHAIDALLTPRSAKPGERLAVKILVSTRDPRRAPARVTVILSSSSGPAETRELPLTLLPSGDLAAEGTVVMPVRGTLEIEARIDGRDPFPEDDASKAWVSPANVTRVGVLGSAPAWVSSLRADSRLEIVNLDAATLLSTPVDVLTGVDWAPESWNAFETAVESWVAAGGGYLHCGESAGFAAASFERSPLTKWLPLRPSEDSGGEELLILVDASGSMAGVKMDAAKQGARVLASLAGSKARLRVATFRRSLEKPLDARGPAFLEWLSRVEPRGETDVLGALQSAITEFDVKSTRRRIYLVSDGLEKGGRAPLDDARRRGEALRGAGIEIRAFAVGEDSDREFLAALTLDGSNGSTFDIRDAATLPAALREEWGRGHLTPGGAVTALRPGGAPLTFDALPPVVAVVKTEPAPGALVAARIESGFPVMAWHPAARVAAFAAVPGSPIAPAYGDAAAARDLWSALFSALSRDRGDLTATFAGDRILLAGLPEDIAAATLTQGNVRATAWRRDRQGFEGPAGEIQPGLAAVQSLTGETLGSVFVGRPVPREASPHLTAVRWPGIESLTSAASARGAPLAFAALAAGLASLLVGAALGRFPRG